MMVRFIGMEYLAALALIKLNKEEISLSELNDFRINVIKALEDNQISSVFLFSDNYAVELVRNYSDCFKLTNNDTILKRLVSSDVLISRFVSYLSNDIIKAVYKRQKQK